MLVDVYTFAWNEEKLVPFFLRHYHSGWVRKIFVYDNQSTDMTVELLKADARVVIVPYHTGGKFLEPAGMQRVRDECWKGSIGQVEWALLVDFDEFVCCLGRMDAFLGRCESVCRTFGWQMVGSEFPTDNGLGIEHLVRMGFPCSVYSKPSLFRVADVVELRSVPGFHTADPLGHNEQPIPICPYGSLWTLHFKLLGWDYYWQRITAQRERVPDELRRRGISDHLGGSMEEHRKLFAKAQGDAICLF